MICDLRLKSAAAGSKKRESKLTTKSAKVTPGLTKDVIKKWSSLSTKVSYHGGPTGWTQLVKYVFSSTDGE